jgi:hypothetical protein
MCKKKQRFENVAAQNCPRVPAPPLAMLFISNAFTICISRAIGHRAASGSYGSVRYPSHKWDKLEFGHC